MDSKIRTFIDLANLFEENGFKLFLVGGSVRDYLLNKPLTDMDVATDATPEDEIKFLNNLDTTFAKYGSTKLIFKGVKFDVTTFRKEREYSDSRHPSKVQYTTDINEDVSRRDITINALYLDKDLNVIDLVDGVKDLNNHLIRIIGDPNTRLLEDPLRIVRILRFKLDLGFELDDDTYKAIKNHIQSLEKLNPDKITQEINKSSHKEELKSLLTQLSK